MVVQMKVLSQNTESECSNILIYSKYVKYDPIYIERDICWYTHFHISLKQNFYMVFPSSRLLTKRRNGLMVLFFGETLCWSG